MDFQSGNTIALSLATLITTIVINKLKLEHGLYYSIIYTLAFNAIIYIYNNDTNFNLDIINKFVYIKIYIFLIILIIVLVYFIKKYKHLFISKVNNKYTIINIYNSNSIQTVIKYMKLFPEFYDTVYDLDIGDEDLIYDSLLLSVHQDKNNDDNKIKLNSDNLINISASKIDFPIEFNDTNLNIKGFLKWKKNKRSIPLEKNNIDVTIKYLELNILKENDKINTSCIIDKMKNIIDETDKNNIQLKYIKVMSINKRSINHTITFYNDKKKPIEELETKYIYTFFHQERDRLWYIIKNIALNPDHFTSLGQSARINLLLYGPPGSGKSTFAYRIAMCLHRHIISLDLREYKNKADIYQIIQRPNIEDISGELHLQSYKESIIMFEEFDISLKELHLRDKLKKKKVTKFINKMEKLHVSNDYNQYEDKNKNDENNEILFSNSYVNYDDFTLRDLLEIFQGPVPLEGSILIGTTNKYDEIASLCPELFRSGRMTPVFFGYITRDVLHDVTKFYFNKKVDGYIPEILNIPTSKIIEMAIEHSFNKEHGFNKFKIQLKKLL
jgi:predicted kinase